MKEKGKIRFCDYLELRKDNKGFLSYGLQRRLSQIEKLIKYVLSIASFDIVNVLDFGCADDLTLKYLMKRFPEKIGKGVGLDIFMHGMPDQKQENLTFIKIDLFRDFPYPFVANSYNVAICSAFYKHHPYPRRFLEEICRILEGGGYLLLLDPCPWVITIGTWLRYFERRYCPNVWSRNDISLIISNLHPTYGYKFEQILYEKYWIAPNNFLFRLGIEKAIPRWLQHYAGLHQSVLLQKVGLE